MIGKSLFKLEVGSTLVVLPEAYVMADLPMAVTAVVSALADKLPLAWLHSLGELGGDAIRLRRFGRLVRILEQAHEIAESKGILPKDMKVLADHVGLPWIDKASLRDEEDLQKAWANLFVAITTEDNEDLHGTCVRILGEMNPWDCTVLDHMARNAVALQSASGNEYIAIPVREEDVVSALASEVERRTQTHVSIENLVRLGCLVRSVPAPISVGGPVYSTLREALAVSTTGIHLYCTSTGQELQSIAPVRTEDEIIDMLGLRGIQIKRSKENYPG